MSNTLQKKDKEGSNSYNHAVNLFPICRSLTGQGVKDTLSYIDKEIKDLNIVTVPTGYKAFDWEVPNEWNIKEAWVKNSKGEKIINFEDHNLHVMGYSEPVDKELTLEELKENLYSLPDQKEAIPYITSYYKRRWGFCLKHSDYEKLPDDTYHAYINSTLEPGELSLGEVIVQGQTDSEILISTYICHPSMANNELSGPSLAIELVKWLQSLNGKHRYTYRFLFLVETIGSIVYLSKHLDHMQRNTKAGFVLSCVGDNLTYSMVSTPDEDTLADKALEHVLKHHSNQSFKKYPFTERGSDERQYCSVGVDLPVVGLCRSKYDEYPEYHTSLDDLDFISAEGLQGSFDVMTKTINLLENNKTYKTMLPCEPQLGKRGLYPTTSTKESMALTIDMMNIIAYSNGKRSLLEIAEKTNTDASKFYDIVNKLLSANIIEVLDLD